MITDQLSPRDYGRFIILIANVHPRKLDGEIGSSGADTVVVIDGQILGKPRDRDEARAMLRTLSGRVHRVITAYALAKNGTVLEQGAPVSEVTFRTLREEQIEEYTATDEPYDKAGA